jgi:hypothetical protein
MGTKKEGGPPAYHSFVTKSGILIRTNYFGDRQII